MYKIIGDVEMNLNVLGVKFFCFCYFEIFILNYVK